MLRAKGNVAEAGTAADAPLEDCVLTSALLTVPIEAGSEPSFIATQYRRPPPLSSKSRPPVWRIARSVMELLVAFDATKSSIDEVGLLLG